MAIKNLLSILIDILLIITTTASMKMTMIVVIMMQTTSRSYNEGRKKISRKSVPQHNP